MSWIQTYTGKKFYPLNPKIEDICISDDEFVYLNTDGNEHPLMFTSDSIENYKTFIMPVRIMW